LRKINTAGNICPKDTFLQSEISRKIGTIVKEIVLIIT
jgi:hypothetical protein